MAPATRRPAVGAPAGGIRARRAGADEGDRPVRPARPSRPGRAARPRRAGGSAGPRPGRPAGVLVGVPNPTDADDEAGDDSRVPLLDRPLASYYLLASSAGLLLLLGLVMVLSASSVRSFADFGSSYTIFVRQATWMGIGVPVLLAASRMPIPLFRRFAYPLLAVTLLLLVLVLIPPFGREVNGARRWLWIGSYNLQPSELAKLALVLWSADLLTRKRRLLTDWRHLIIPIVPMAVLIGGLIMLQPDMGTTIVVLSVLLIVLWVVGTPLRVFAALVGGIGLAGTVLAVIEPYRLERLMSYRDPFQDASDTGFQAVQGLYALSSGGWWGEGLGASREKWPDLLPAAHTDFILAIIGEELGLLGSLVVVFLFGVLGYAGLRVAHRTDDHFVRLAAAGSIGWILIQAMVNIGAVIGLLPITGIPLPLVSFGGSSLIPTMLTLGMLLAFARAEPAAARVLAERSAVRRSARRARRADRAAGRAAPGGGDGDGGAGPVGGGQARRRRGGGTGPRGGDPGGRRRRAGRSEASA